MLEKKFLILVFLFLMFVFSCGSPSQPGEVGSGGNKGDGGGINVPDNGTGYYPYAKTFTGFGNLITNVDPVVSALHPMATPNNSIEDSIGSRIPSALVLPSGRIVITGDIRWTGNADLPHKTDTFVRYSDNNGTSWSAIKTALKFNDLDTTTFANINKGTSGTDKSAGQLKITAAAADAPLGRAKDGTLLSLATAGAHSTGMADRGYGPGVVPASAYKNFKGKTYLMLRKRPNVNFNDFTISSSTAQSQGSTREDVPISDTTQFKYGVEVSTTRVSESVNQLQEFTFSGGSITAATPVDNVWVDEKLYLWENKNKSTPIKVKQLGVTRQYKYQELAKTTQAHLFYANSPYWPFRRYTHITMVRSYDNGKTWSEQADIITALIRSKTDPKMSSMSGLFFMSPTAGYMKRFGKNKGRLYFSAYAAEIAQRVIVFWTDDAGKTWETADNFIPVGGGVGSMSETAIVEAPDGTLIAVSRGGATPSYATSRDSGKTWTQALLLDDEIDALGSCQVFAHNLSQWKGANGEALVVISAASGNSRHNGKATMVALVKDTDNPDRGWKFDTRNAFGGALQSIQYGDKGGRHDYSSVVEKLDGNLGVYYEGSRTFEAGNGMALDFRTVEMLGK